MNKLSTKLIFAFALLIVVLLVQVFLNFSTNSKAKTDFEHLKNSVGPTIRMLDKFQSVNKELALLIDKQIVGDSKQEINNRVLQIVEVELPYYNSEINLKLSELEGEDPKVFPIKNIAHLTASLIAETGKLSVIIKARDLQKEAKLSSNLLAKSEIDIQALFFQLENNISILIREYNNEFIAYQRNLSASLSSTSNLISLAGFVGVLISLIISIQTLRTVIKPIKDLQYSARQISRGNYDMRVPVTGNNELAQLGKSFNKMADELKENFTALELKNKELEQFIYIASHDLQEPLRTISSFTDLLKIQYQHELDAKANKFLSFMTQSTKRMSDLISGLLDYSRIGKTKEKESVNCQDLVSEVLGDMTASLIKYDAQVDYKDLPTVVGYKTDLRLLFQNIISNAIKFRKPKVAPNVTISGRLVGDAYEFEIKDNGIGIPKSHQEKVFAIFQRLHAKDKFEGTGIGLAHCKKIIDFHDGKIWVKSILDVGTSFYFTLPR